MSIQENYHNTLNGEGIASSRIDDLCDAMDKLHYALSKCDFTNRRKFFEKDIITRLKEYGETTGMSDVTNRGIKTATNCYVPVKKEGDYLIGLKIKDTPGTQLMCQDKSPDGTQRAMSFAFFQDAAAFCMERNIEMGLKADDITAIVKSSTVRENELLNGVDKTFLPDYTPKEETTAVKEAYPSKTILLLEDVTSALIDAKIASGLSEDEAISIPVVAKVEAFRREYYGLDKVNEIVEYKDNYVPAVKAAREAIIDSPVSSVTIQKNQDGEYRVPGPAGKEEAAAYYTDEREDAVSTTKAMYGADVAIKFKTVEQHKSVEDNKSAVDVPVKSGRSRR